MVILLDVDDYFERRDFYLYWQQNLKWPWPETHFLKRDLCFGCGHSTNMYSLHHFILTNEDEMLKKLFLSDFFWCQLCHFSIYEHYPADECTKHCN
jgi:hypothetical protein